MKSFRNNFPTCGVIFLDNKSIHRVPFKNRKSKTLSSDFFFLHSSVHESLGLPVSTRHFLFSLTESLFCRRTAGTWQRTDLSKHGLLCLQSCLYFIASKDRVLLKVHYIWVNSLVKPNSHNFLFAKMIRFVPCHYGIISKRV